MEFDYCIHRTKNGFCCHLMKNLYLIGDYTEQTPFAALMGVLERYGKYHI